MIPIGIFTTTAFLAEHNPRILLEWGGIRQSESAAESFGVPIMAIGAGVYRLPSIIPVDWLAKRKVPLDFIVTDML